MIEWRIDWGWLARHSDRIGEQFLQHLALTTVSVALGLVVSLALAVVATRSARVRRVVLSGAGIIYTVPSFALILLLVPFTGLRALTVALPLSLYTLLALLRNMLAGIDAVPGDVREAALGMGYTRGRLLWEVELPLALPVIVAGLRIATVTTVGLVTVGGFIGIGGLGNFVFDGLRRFFLTPLLVGTLGSLLLALALDGLLLVAERALAPWTVRRA